ncbi:MAG: biopolymer transporter ExbD [Nevskiaceae bacterium]|nr:MAG: biopolymer transporter ExbD [Nevskiaceae bacterium]TBR71941.1 MAG: biopolymer transporter ExbD [Nevskiaceae bacterium]
MRLRRHSSPVEDARIDLAPMLDFFTNLMIFFIISAAFVTQAGIHVQPPAAHTAQPLDNPSIIVAISADGEVYVNQQHSDIRLLRAAIAALRQQHPKSPVLVQADRDARAGLIVAAMDAARQAGVDNVALAAVRAP